MRYLMMALTAAVALLASTLVSRPAQAESPKGKPRLLRVGAVAYDPSSVTVWRGIQQYFTKKRLPIDYVLYSNYDALVDALKDGHVDIAWNTPLAHARYHLLCGGQSQTLVMRDVDRDCRAVLIARKDADASKMSDLSGKTIVLGSNDAAEATVLPLYYLKKQGVSLDKVKLLSLHGELDTHGCPCSSEKDVLQALQKGRGQAGIISEGMWKRLQAKMPDEAAMFRVVWTSPRFSHCVFTAAKDFDKNIGDRFRELMVAMDGKDPRVAEIFELEGCKKWLPGKPEGFEDLVKALQRASNKKSLRSGGR